MYRKKALKENPPLSLSHTHTHTHMKEVWHRHRMASEVLKAVRKAIDEGILQVAARLGSAEAWSGLGERTKQHEPFLELLRPLHSERNGHRHLMTDIHEYCEYIAGGYW